MKRYLVPLFLAAAPAAAQDSDGPSLMERGAQMFLEGLMKEVEPRLAIPECEFGIIAGGHNDGQGYTPLLDGDDDGTVTVATTRLPGASDFIVIPSHHTLIESTQRTKELVLKYFQHGYFDAADRKQPIKRDESHARVGS